MEPLRDTVVTLGYGGATRRYFSDTRVLLEKCGAIMSGAREPTGDKVGSSYLLFLVAYVNLVSISKSTDS